MYHFVDDIDEGCRIPMSLFAWHCPEALNLKQALGRVSKGIFNQLHGLRNVLVLPLSQLSSDLHMTKESGNLAYFLPPDLKRKVEDP